MSGAAIRSLSCPACGATIPLRGFGFSQSIACPSCTSVLDASDPNLAVLQRFQQGASRFKPLIPLGTRGTWKGDPWEVIGFQVREIRVDDVAYRWHEYLLFNPFRGFRYLSWYDGHWSDIVAVRGLPSTGQVGAHPVATWRDTDFKLFQTSFATTIFALGEFPWMLTVGDQVTVRDYVAPPFMLSSEATEGEVTWSLGEYVVPERIQAAFKLKEALPKPIGTFAHQPNPLVARAAAYWRAFALLAAVLVGLAVLRRATATDLVVATQSGVYRPGVAGDKQPFVTEPFTLAGRTSPVEIGTDATVDGSWLYASFTLVNDSTGQVIDAGHEVAWYHGVDDGESWSEGSPSERTRIAAVPAGRWFLRVEFDGPDTGAPIKWTLSVRRDRPQLLWWLAGFLVLLVPPALVALRSHAFETTRWAESDFAPVSSDDSDDSDDSSDD